MLKQEITYTDLFTNEEVTKPFYFHLNAPEVMRIIGRSRNMAWEEYVMNIVNSGDSDAIMDFLETFVSAAVGQRTPEGLFVKSAEYRDWFLASDAYGELFIKFINDEDFARSFFTKIVQNGSGDNKPSAIPDTFASGAQ